MHTVLLLILAILLAALPVSSLAAPKMRPYSGIGVLQLSSVGLTEAIPLYDDPGISRCCKLEFAVFKELNSWLFGRSENPYLLVTARKAEWLEIEHDDAGRTGWILPERRWHYLPWDQFLKGRMVLFLRNSPKKLMQVVSHPGAVTGTPLTIKQAMKVILAQGDWAYVLFDSNSSGWIRWRDSDGRLLIGFDITTTK
jgi:hypothetical protein